MGRGPRITDEVRMLVARLHQEHPKWTTRMIRNEVSCIVHKKDPRLLKGWPSKYAIDRIMPDLRERARRRKCEPDPIDRPWTVESMSNSSYHISPEALPAVLRVWFHVKQKGRHLSIREAQWVGRLYTAITDIETLYSTSYMASCMDSFAGLAGVDDSRGTEAVNLYLFSAMTGHVVTSEEAESVGASMGIGPKGENLLLVPWLQPVEHIICWDWDLIRRGCELAEKIRIGEEEASNERQHKTKRQE